MQNSKIAICGGSGLVGREMIKLLEQLNIPYITTYNKNPVENGLNINFFDIDEIETCFKSNEVTSCINCIVERQVETCEKNWEKTCKTNIQIAENIAKVCSKLGIHLIHISTDYVFDGKHAPYYPESLCNPLQNYGISKLISELRVKTYCNNYCIVRVPVLYTDNINNIMETAVTLIGKKIMDLTKHTTEDNYSVRRPTYIPDFCKFLYHLSSIEATGIYHFGNNVDKTSKYLMAQSMALIMNKPLNLTPINEPPNDGVERPLDTHLVDSKYNISDFTFTPLQPVLENVFGRFYHPKIRPENVSDFMFLIDLDGTLIDSDPIHYTAYDHVFNDEYHTRFGYNEYIELVNTNKLDEYLMGITGDKFAVLKKNKQKELMFICTQMMVPGLMPGAREFIKFLVEHKCNYCVVTNTTRENVELFQEIVPELIQLTNWITREDYDKSKPDKECYMKALAKYRRNEDYVIGIENTLCGVKALQGVTSLVYCMMDDTNRKYVECEDVFLFNHYSQIVSQSIVNSDSDE